MTKIEERLKKIQNKGAQMIADANAEEERKKSIIKKYEQDIKALAPRVAELIAIAIELMKNDIPLGVRKSSITGTPKDDLVTDGIDHKLGFYFSYEGGKTRFVGVGISGGGCDGRDIAVNENGTMVKHPDPYYQSYRYFGYNDYCDKCSRFLKNFDDFEKRVNDFVDNL